jgi:hypothetical protein
MTKNELKSNGQGRIVVTLAKVCAARPPFFMFSKRKAAAMAFEKWGGGEGLCLHSQEGQDLCARAAAEELIFNTSSEHQTVDLSNKWMAKDFLRDFRYGSTVDGGQEDRTFDIHLPVDT